MDVYGEQSWWNFSCDLYKSLFDGRPKRHRSYLQMCLWMEILSREKLHLLIYFVLWVVMFAIQYAFQFLKKIQKLISMLWWSLWIVVGSLWIVVGRCGSLWIVVDRCGSLWVVPGFSNYVWKRCLSPPIKPPSKNSNICLSETAYQHKERGRSARKQIKPP